MKIIFIIVINKYIQMNPPSTMNPLSKSDENTNTHTIIQPKYNNTRYYNINTWIYTLSYGTLSVATCCLFCGGCFGQIDGPDMLYGYKNEVEVKDDINRDTVNCVKWMEACMLGVKYLPTLGCCCGFCGTFLPTLDC